MELLTEDVEKAPYLSSRVEMVHFVGTSAISMAIPIASTLLLYQLSILGDCIPIILNPALLT